MSDCKQILLPDVVQAQIARMNGDYLALVQQVSQTDPCAGAILGLPQETVRIFETIRTLDLLPLVQSGFLLPRLRIVDPGFWHRVASGEVDATYIIHALIASSMEDA